MTYRLASQTSGFNGERRTPDLPSPQENEPRANRMFTLKGRVTSLEISDGSFDPSQAFEQRIYGNGAGTQAANQDRMTPFDKRIAVQHFGCYIGERVVVGTFPSVGFHSGDQVKAVVTNLDGEGVLAHALMRASDGRLWLPHFVCRGTHASLLESARIVAAVAALAWIGVLVVMLAWPPRGGVLAPVCLAGLVFLAVGAGAVFLINRGKPEAAYADKLMTMLGFRNPKMVDLSRFSERARDTFEQRGSPHVYHLWPALAKYGMLKRRRPG